MKAKVIMLPTEDETDLVIDGATSKLFYSKESLGYWHRRTKFQHLYLVADEEMEIGDCGLIKCEHCYVTGILDYDHEHSTWDLITNYNMIYPLSDKKYFKKIVATTDSNLKRNISFGKISKNIKTPLPKIPSSFIEKYCELGNIDEVQIEFLSDNKINVFETKTSWNKEEVCELIFDAVSESHDWSRENGNINSIGIIGKKFLNNWIKENL